MASDGGLLGLGVGILAAGAATAAGVAADRLLKARRTAIELGLEVDYDDIPDHEDVVISDAVPLHVEIDDPVGAKIGERPTVVLSHGYTQHHGVWHFQRKALREAGFRVVLWDHRGHGLSEQGEESSYTIAQLGRDLHAVITEAAPDGPLILMGHSMGGMAMMAMAEQFPEIIRERVVGAGFVCTSSGALSTLDFGLGKQVGAAVHRLGPGTVARLSARQSTVERVLELGKDVESYLVHRYSFGSDVPMAVVRYTADMIFETPMSVISAFMPTLVDHERTDVLAEFDGIETLVIHGQQDRIVPRAHADVMVAKMPHAEYIVVENSGHMLPLEHPEIVNTEIVALAERASRAVVEPPSKRRSTVPRTVTDLRPRRKGVLEKKQKAAR
ncbi:pimeloyl-ACP methyl ester carboxylesterase [Yimella lutea]|uniref:Pimeloyl-ACP methyl ester carboxylesterase n=1 Tax=Yimella lutea TaxID=587872 RepID=A0A542EK18_9MICO|nr:alpha/beta hydrolase [Yimella lutea]TQJ15687.1 pimeloyl-ACP methyl ester carboxylesterase [Yimella lutea]